MTKKAMKRMSEYLDDKYECAKFEEEILAHSGEEWHKDNITAHEYEGAIKMLAYMGLYWYRENGKHTVYKPE